jgi:hypothetical protein
MEFPPILAIIGSYAAIAKIVWTLFERADKALNEETKKEISFWLQIVSPSIDEEKWANQSSFTNVN